MKQILVLLLATASQALNIKQIKDISAKAQLHQNIGAVVSPAAEEKHEMMPSGSEEEEAIKEEIIENALNEKILNMMTEKESIDS